MGLKRGIKICILTNLYQIRFIVSVTIIYLCIYVYYVYSIQYVVQAIFNTFIFWTKG